jgi:hypothetical protein
MGFKAATIVDNELAIGAWKVHQQRFLDKTNSRFPACKNSHAFHGIPLNSQNTVL